jgi:hypothetical protein
MRGDALLSEGHDFVRTDEFLDSLATHNSGDLVQNVVFRHD